MKIKVHWIVDGIAELDAKNQEEAEKWVNEVLTQILNDNPCLLYTSPSPRDRG